MSEGTPTIVDQHRRAQLMRRATMASILVAISLVLIKAAAWLMTDSVSLLSSLVDSFVDSIASLINLFAVRTALTPADREHRFGHGKAEPMAGLAQAAFIAGSALFLIVEAFGRLLNPAPVSQASIGITVMVISIIATGLLVAYQRSVIRRTGSIAVSADALHYASDVLVNSGVILALVLATALQWWLADPLIALIVALYIVHAAWSILKQSLDQLMDRELSEDIRQQIQSIALAPEKVLAMHELKTRESGLTTFIQLHLEMDGSLTLDEAHETSQTVHDALLEAFPNAEILIHQDPAGLDENHEEIQ